MFEHREEKQELLTRRKNPIKEVAAVKNVERYRKFVKEISTGRNEKKKAALAQLVEQHFCKVKVVRSNRTGSSRDYFNGRKTVLYAVNKSSNLLSRTEPSSNGRGQHCSKV